MNRYITLGADENGEVYGLELGEDGRWVRNPLGLATSCTVIRPLSKENYEYVTEDPESAKELWQIAVRDDRTELGLQEWFEEYVANDDPIDASYVFELLEDDDNPTVSKHNLYIKKRIEDSYEADEEDETDEEDCLGRSDCIWDEDGQPMSFRRRVELELVESDVVESADDVYEWECSGWFPPKRPFVVEFAPKELLEEYYAHLRKTYKEFKG